MALTSLTPHFQGCPGPLLVRLYKPFLRCTGIWHLQNVCLHHARYQDVGNKSSCTQRLSPGSVGWSLWGMKLSHPSQWRASNWGSQCCSGAEKGRLEGPPAQEGVLQPQSGDQIADPGPACIMGPRQRKPGEATPPLPGLTPHSSDRPAGCFTRRRG